MGHYDLVGLSLLLVDESLLMRRIIRSILTSLGVKDIREAVDASACLREAQTATSSWQNLYRRYRIIRE